MKSSSAILLFAFLLISCLPVEAGQMSRSCQIRHPAFYFETSGSRFHGNFGPRHFRQYHPKPVRRLVRTGVLPPGRTFRHTHHFVAPRIPRRPIFPAHPRLHRPPAARVAFGLEVFF